MAVHSHDDFLMCRVFPSSLKGVALNWFYTFPLRSLRSFEEISNAFNQYALRQEFKKNSNCLLTVGRERKSRKSTTRKPRRRRNSSRHRSTGRSTGVHQRAQAIAVDRPVDRRRRTVDRPVDRLTWPYSRLGAVDRHGRPGLGLVDRLIWPYFRLGAVDWHGRPGLGSDLD